jgi:putative tricarboxylic transport membrane protein
MVTKQRMPLVVAGVFVLFAVFYLAEAAREPFGTPDQLGPGVYPVLVGLLMLGSSLGLALQAARGRQAAQAPIEWPTGKALGRMLAVAGASAGYILLMPYLGDAVAGILAMLLVLRVMGMKRWWLVCALAVGMALTFHYVFVVLLSIPLPRGILFD